MESKLYYRLANIKSAYLAHEYQNENLKEYVRNYYFTYLFLTYDIKEVYSDNMHVLITKSDYERIILPIDPYIKKYNSFANVKPVALSKDSEKLTNTTNSYIISRFTRHFVANNYQKGLQSIKNNGLKYKRHLSNLKLIKSVDMIASIDFEYNGLDFDCVSEIGVSLYYPKTEQTIYLYYIINGFNKNRKKKFTLQNSFNFGETRIVTSAEAYNELIIYIKEADFLVAHDISNEMQILKMKPDWSKIIDTKYCELSIEPQERYLSLSETLKKRKIPFSHLHNAGNDAAYALKLLIHMYNEISPKEKVA